VKLVRRKQRKKTAGDFLGTAEIVRENGFEEQGRVANF